MANSVSAKWPPLLLILSLASVLTLANYCVNPVLCGGTPTNPEDVDALLSLKQYWNGLPSNWVSGTDPCDDSSGWLGITCNTSVSESRVTRIILINRDLEGTISPAIGNLTSLEHFDVSSNPMLGGSLPKEIGKLVNIQRFYVQYCNLTGSIPAEIGTMRSIKYFGLSSNDLTGSIPETIGFLTTIFWFDASYNRLNGTLPMSYNTNIGVGLDNLTNAEHLHLQSNRFSGSIPTYPEGMLMLHLLLAENEFTGSIPESISNFKHLDIIRLDSNRLTGTIPDTISDIVNLTTLNLSSNVLTGTVPAFTDRKLSVLILSNNNLTGTLNLSNSASLTHVDASNNNIKNVINVKNNSIAIQMIGNPYCDDKKTNDWCTNNTQVTPPPKTLSSALSPSSSNAKCTCKQYYRVNPNLANCQCVQPVIAKWSFYALKVFSLELLSDATVDTLVQEFIRSWNDTQLTGGIQLEPSQVLIEVTDPDTMQISIFPPNGEVIWNAENATTILYVLNNQDIWFRDQGPMGCSIPGPPYPIIIYKYALSLGAKIGIGVGAAIAAIVIIGLVYYVMLLTRKVRQVEKLNRPFAAWIASSKGKELSTSVPQLKGARWFSLSEIHKYTDNFSKGNEIGSGGYGKVYKGYLPSGEYVAIKRSSVTSLQGAAEFKTEIELLSRVHHRNLVGLIGFCFEEGEQMLVYPFMPNGTLRDCLSGKNDVEMNLGRRIEIALGAARGLAYLHNEANPTIIHRDIKSNNILLDDKQVAMVADFGLSKLSPAEGEEGYSINVKGTLGYLDPNYYLTNQFTDKSDVYSFGVVLLELITGKQPIERGKYIVREVECAYSKGGMDLIKETLLDPSLANTITKELKRLLELALSCIQDEPMERPTMNEVVKELEDIANLQPKIKSMSLDVSNDQFNHDKERARFYNTVFPKLQETYESTSFAYSGDYESLVRPIDPK